MDHVLVAYIDRQLIEITAAALNLIPHLAAGLSARFDTY